MSNIINIPVREHPDHPEIEAEARAWIIQFDGARPTEDELHEFREWLGRSPLHKQIFKRTVSVWNDMDMLADLLSEEDATLESLETAPVRRRSIFARLNLTPAHAIFAFIVAFILVVAGYVSVPGLIHDEVFLAEYQTAVGELKAVALPDGSSIHLNTGSRINVSYNEGGRIIRLDEGEAYFNVSHDKEKPFVVYANNFAIKAVGTAFSVHVLDEGVDLTVTDGRVEVITLDKKLHRLEDFDLKQIDRATARVPMVKGQHVIFNDEKQELELAQKIEPGEIEKKLSWRDGMFIFDNDSLEDVVAEINRYSSMKLVISDSDIRDLRFGGYFRINDMPSILVTFEEAFGIKVDRINENLIYLSRKEHAE